MPRGRLLILDDDAMVGQLLVFVAQSAGFEARQCDEAKAFFDAVAEWQPTHVAIDLSMPGTSGAEVLRGLAGVGCGAKVIISSGASRSELEDALLEARALGLATAGILPKPFSLAAMRTLLAADDDPAAHDTTGAT